MDKQNKQFEVKKFFLGQVRGQFVLIYLCGLKQILRFLVAQWFSLLISDDLPWNGIFPFILSIPFHFNPPHVDQIANTLDTYPISTFLKFWWVVVRLEATIQTSTLHSCGQWVRYRAFNAVVSVLDQDISPPWWLISHWSLSSPIGLPITRCLMSAQILGLCSAWTRGCGSSNDATYPLWLILLLGLVLYQLGLLHAGPWILWCPLARPMAQYP